MASSNRTRLALPDEVRVRPLGAEAHVVGGDEHPSVVHDLVERGHRPGGERVVEQGGRAAARVAGGAVGPGDDGSRTVLHIPRDHHDRAWSAGVPASSRVVVYRMRHACASSGTAIVNGSLRTSRPGEDGTSSGASQNASGPRDAAVQDRADRQQRERREQSQKGPGDTRPPSPPSTSFRPSGCRVRRASPPTVIADRRDDHGDALQHHASAEDDRDDEDRDVRPPDRQEPEDDGGEAADERGGPLVDRAPQATGHLDHAADDEPEAHEDRQHADGDAGPHRDGDAEHHPPDPDEDRGWWSLGGAADASSVRPVRMQPQITSTTSTASDANGLSTR
jgi:hypothetical protein